MPGILFPLYDQIFDVISLQSTQFNILFLDIINRTVRI